MDKVDDLAPHTDLPGIMSTYVNTTQLLPLPENAGDRMLVTKIRIITDSALASHQNMCPRNEILI